MKKLINYILLISISIGFMDAQVGINTSNPDASAIVDLGPGDRALIHNRVALTAKDDVTTVNAPKNGGLVFNTKEVVSDTLFADALYYYNADPDYKRWTNVLGDKTLEKFIITKKVPIYVGQIYKLDSQPITQFLGDKVNVVKWGTAPSASRIVLNSDVIERVTGSISTFKVKSTGIYAFDGFVNWKFNSGTTFWTVAIQTGVTSDSQINVPPTFDFGMRCPYYSWSQPNFYDSCTFSGAIKLEAGSTFRIIVTRKNGSTPTSGQIGGDLNYAAGLKIVYFPE